MKDDTFLPIVEPVGLADVFVSHIAKIEQVACCTRFYMASVVGTGAAAHLEVVARLTIPTHLVQQFARLSMEHVDEVSHCREVVGAH